MIEEKVAEGVALGVDRRFSTKTCRMEKRKGLQSAQTRLAFGHRRRRTRNCNTKEKEKGK